ncbi:hypothetical protein MNV49_001477 [Pseudohyphozyma bogoriensis]|nr:hypothetical protein MNV49_001477 [Pseudohyphozyma bogoriensis]
MAPSQDALLSHLLARLTADLDFLASQNLVSNEDLATIKAKLPSAAGGAAATGTPHLARQGTSDNVGPSDMRGGTGGTAAKRAVPPPPPALAARGGAASGVGALNGEQKKRCRAVWDYVQSQEDDLPFQKGDIITIEEEPNADWWRGSLDGRTGIFPSNHVERMDDAVLSPPLATGSSIPISQRWQPHTQYSYTPPPAQSTYTPPPPPTYHSPTPPAGLTSYGAPSSEKEKAGDGSYYSPAPPQQPQQAVVVTNSSGQAAPPIPPKKGSKLGKQMASSFAGGIGFGAGMAIASDAVNAIF